MRIKDIIEKLRELRGLKEPEQLPEGQTHDPHLRSLRRQRMRQMEELEKEQLKHDIAAYNLEKTREFIGIKKQILREKIRQKQKKQSYFKSGYLSKAKL